MSSSEGTDDVPDLGAGLIAGYSPFIADVCMSAPSRPLPVPTRERRTVDEVDRVRHAVRLITNSQNFGTPVSLADFCLNAEYRWNEDDSADIQCSTRMCQIS